MKQRTLLNVSSSINLVFVLNKLCCFLPDEFTERMRCIAIGITPPPHTSTTQEPSGQNLLPFQIYLVLSYFDFHFSQSLTFGKLDGWKRCNRQLLCQQYRSHIWQFLLLLKVNTVLDESILSLRAAQEWANDILQKLKSGKFVKVCIWN